jgi:predicted nucleic acid-binding protein
VLDANILIRAVLGSRVLSLLRKYGDQMEFLAPDTAFQEAREHLPQILERRNLPLAPALAVLELVTALVQTIEIEAYSRFESVARERIGRRDEDDWPILASALALIVRYGPKPPTSSAAAWRLGQPTEWSCIWRRRILTASTKW